LISGDEARLRVTVVVEPDGVDRLTDTKRQKVNPPCAPDRATIAKVPQLKPGSASSIENGSLTTALVRGFYRCLWRAGPSGNHLFRLLATSSCQRFTDRDIPKQICAAPVPKPPLFFDRASFSPRAFVMATAAHREFTRAAPALVSCNR